MDKGKIIKQLRIENHMTQEELAEKLTPPNKPSINTNPE